MQADGNGNSLEDELLMAFHVVFVALVLCRAREHNKSNNNNHGLHEFSLGKVKGMGEGEGRRRRERGEGRKGTLSSVKQFTKEPVKMHDRPL